MTHDTLGGPSQGSAVPDGTGGAFVARPFDAWTALSQAAGAMGRAIVPFTLFGAVAFFASVVAGLCCIGPLFLQPILVADVARLGLDVFDRAPWHGERRLRVWRSWRRVVGDGVTLILGVMVVTAPIWGTALFLQRQGELGWFGDRERYLLRTVTSTALLPTAVPVTLAWVRWADVGARFDVALSFGVATVRRNARETVKILGVWLAMRALRVGVDFAHLGAPWEMALANKDLSGLKEFYRADPLFWGAAFVTDLLSILWSWMTVMAIYRSQIPVTPSGIPSSDAA